MIYIGLYCILAMISIITNNGKKLYQRRVQCFTVFIAMLLIMGLRDPSYGGVDVEVYVRDFNRLCTYRTLGQVFTNFYKDYGFYVFSWLFSRICKDSQIWIFFCAFVYLYPVTRFIYRRSENVFFSFFMFLSFNYYLYNFQLMRHVFSLGLCVIAFEHLLDNEYKKFIIWDIVAALFHPFALILLFAILLQKSGVGVKQILFIIAGSFGMILLMKTSLLSSFVRLLGSSGRFEQYADRGSGGLSDFVMHTLFAASAWIMLYGTKKSGLITGENVVENFHCAAAHHSSGLKIRLKRNERYACKRIDYGLMMNMAIVSAVLYLGEIGVGEAYRVAQYFSVFTVVFIPNVYHRYKEKKYALLLMTIIVVLGLRHFFGGLFMEGSVYNPYVFFWE